MKAIVQGKFGSPRDVLELAEIDKPTATDDEVLVRVRAASIHIGDFYGITGVPYVMRPLFAGMRPKSRVPGTDISGTVEAVGDKVTQLQPGDEVFGSYKAAFAEFASFPEKSLAMKPANLTFDQASAIGVSALTALQALRDHGKVQPGHKVLIVGASGGVGTFAVQIAKELGAEVTGVCSTRNADMVRSIGADHIVDYTQEDFTSGENRYDLIFDNVGVSSPAELRRVLTPTGVLLTNGAKVGGWFGGLKEPITSFFSSLLNRQQGRPFLSTSKPEDLAELRRLAEEEKIAPVMDRSFPLQEAPDAVAYVGEGHAQGKTIITVD